MYKLVIASAACAALIGAPAMAADRPITPPVAQAAPFSWTGLYVGFNVGGGWSRTRWTVLPSSEFDYYQGDGAVVGGYAGYNIQVLPWLVLGVEGAGAWANVNMDGIGCTVDVTALCTSHVTGLWSARGRAGIAFERVLGYVALGWGGADATYTRVFQPTGIPPTTGASPSLSGWSSAGGIEFALTDHFIGRVQYDYYDFNKTSNPAGALSDVAVVDVRTRVHSITAGLAYKFGGGAGY